MKLLLWTKPWKTLPTTIGPLIAQSGVSHEVIEFADTLPTLAQGDLLLAMGSEPVQVLAASKVVPKGRAIRSLRNRLHPVNGVGEALVTYAPTIGEVDYELYVDLLTDVRSALRYLDTGSFAPKLGRYRYVKDFSEAIAWIKARSEFPVPVALDTETLGLDPYALEAFIVSIQITCRPGMADVVRFSDANMCRRLSAKLREQINWLLTSPKVALRMANGKYDMQWLAAIWGLTECTTFGFDTTIVGSLLDENRSNSLNVHAKLHSNIGGYDDPINLKYDKSRMDAIPDDDFLIYAGGDTDACLQVSNELKPLLLKDKKLTTFYSTVLHPAARAYEKVERTGWCVDVPYYRQFRSEIEAEVADYEKQAKEMIGGRMIAKHTRNDGRLNLGKAALLIDFLFSPQGLNLKPKVFTAKTKDPSTAMDHLLMFKDHPKAGPFITVLDSYTSASKILSTYILGFLANLRDDGRFHPNYFMFSGQDEVQTEGGAVTGRLSVKDPAIQTIPKHTKWAKRLRRCFIAPPGYLVLSNDYAQGELKIAACEAEETTMIEAYLKGFDLHALTAAYLAGYKLEDFMALALTNPDLYELLRYRAKAGNFGLIYGMGIAGYIIYARLNYGLDLTLEEATHNHEAFFKLYSRLPDWHKRQRNRAKNHGFVRSPLGRIRHLPLVHSPDREVVSKQLRRAINSPVQATLSDLALWATARMNQLGEFRTAPVFGMIHDQLLSYVPEDQWEAVAQRRREIMENLPLHEVEWAPPLRFTVDSEIGPSLGELEKVKLAA